MTQDDRRAIRALFDRLAAAEPTAPPRDAEAERLIAEALAAQPAAAYRMAQVLIAQDQALLGAKARIARLEADLARERDGGFLSDLFGARPAASPAARSPQPAGPGFLGGAAQTAVGVAGGLFLLDALSWALEGDACPGAEDGASPAEDDGWW